MEIFHSKQINFKQFAKDSFTKRKHQMFTENGLHKGMNKRTVNRAIFPSSKSFLCETILNGWHCNGSVPSSLRMKLELKSRTLIKRCQRAFRFFLSSCFFLFFFNCSIQFTLGNSIYCYWMLIQRNCCWLCGAFDSQLFWFAYVKNGTNEMKTSTSRQTTLTLQETGFFFFSSFHTCTMCVCVLVVPRSKSEICDSNNQQPTRTQSNSTQKRTEWMKRNERSPTLAEIIRKRGRKKMTERKKERQKKHNEWKRPHKTDDT